MALQFQMINFGYRGLEKALHFLQLKKYEEIVNACDEEIQTEENESAQNENVEDPPKVNGTHDSEDEGFSADDSRDSLLHPGSGDGVDLNTR